MQKISKTIFIIIIAFLLVNIFNYTVHAMEIIDPGGYEPSSETAEMSESEIQPFKNKVGYILGAIRNISTVVAVITLMVIGFRYIVGSVEEKAKYKETMYPYIIGAVLAVAGTSIVSYIYNYVH